MAVQYWRNRGEAQRTGLITLHHAYHGDTVGAMSASEDSLFTRAFTPLLFPVARAHSPYCYRCPLGLKRASCKVDCLGDLERRLEEQGERTAAVLVEPMLQGAGGMIVWPAEFLAGVRRLCDRYGVLLIADEVLTGFGRTGRMFACERAEVTPDFMCIAKGLTGGFLSLAATLTTDRVHDAFTGPDRSRAFFHGHSYTANPIACAAANATLQIFDNEPVFERIAAIEKVHIARLPAFATHPCVSD